MLNACYECGGQVSDKAGACPHCGAPVQDKWAAPRQTPVMTTQETSKALKGQLVFYLVAGLGSFLAVGSIARDSALIPWLVAAVFASAVGFVITEIRIWWNHG